jgi:uncharacterized protein (UPF0305 family)
MKNSELFLEIKKDLGRYKFKVKNNEGLDENIDSINLIMSNYNRDNFNEIMNLSLIELDEEIPDEDLNDFKKRIEYFFDLYAPEDKEFKEFIKAISLYLTFIAKKPLHPPGIKFSNGSRVYKNQGFYYCTGKSKFIEDKLSLCKYCVSKQVNTK